MALECPVCLSSLLEPNETEEASPGVDGSGSSRGSRRGGRAGPSRSKPVSPTSCTPCGHIFHTPCLNKWMVQAIGRPTCPVCRKDFTKRRVLPVYLNSSQTSLDVNAAPSTSSSPRAQVAAGATVSPYTGTDFDFLNNLHNSLIDDYNRLQSNYWELRDEYDVGQAQFMSLEHEMESLKATFDARVNDAGNESASSSTSTS